MPYQKRRVKALVPPSEYTRFHLPGFTLPIDYRPHDIQRKWTTEDQENVCYTHDAEGSGEELFPTALDPDDDWGGYVMLPLMALRELTMVQIMNHITDKPGWETKVFDDEIVGRWMEAAGRNDEVTKCMMYWVIAELRHKAQIFQDTAMVIVYDGGIIKSDPAVPESIKHALRDALRPLEEDVPEKDDHPGSDEKVLDLVDPSLFPVVYGRTHILRDELISIDGCLSRMGNGEILPVPQLDTNKDIIPGSMGRDRRAEIKKSYSTKFQWLPCDVELTAESGCKITSYINNLHPTKHKELYPIIEDIIARAIPLWNLTLTPIDRKLRCAAKKQRIQYNRVEYEPVSEHLRPQRKENESEEDFWERESEWDRDHRVVILPEPGEFAPHDSPLLDLRKVAGDRGLQVIVKLANIHLTPEKPAYEGGSWHVEGQMNEHICATALYYYDSSNIAESRLAFRQESSEDEHEIKYARDHHEWLQVVFGCEQHGSRVQEVGEVLCKEGRLLTFPNVLQHRVDPFRLADPSRPGHRKMLALFLVDPKIHVISTANVPPQRYDWWTEEVYRQNSLGRLPAELQSQVMEEVDFPMRMDEAKQLRLELMEERRAFVVEQTHQFLSHTFSLWE